MPTCSGVSVGFENYVLHFTSSNSMFQACSLWNRKKMGWFLCRNATPACCIVLSHCLSLDFPHSCGFPLPVSLPLRFPALGAHCSLCLSPTCLCACMYALLYAGHSVSLSSGHLSVLTTHAISKPAACRSSSCWLQCSHLPVPLLSAQLCYVSAILPHPHTVNVKSLGLETRLPPSFSIRLYIKQMPLCR